MKTLTIDVRMHKHSGIGRYINELIPLLLKKLDESINVVCLGNSGFETNKKNIGLDINFVECNSPIYSLREQLTLPYLIPDQTDLFWVPHYNIPIFYTGDIITTVHDAFHFQKKLSLLKNIYSKIMFESVASRVNKIITVSDFTRSVLEQELNVSSDKILRIYSGIQEKFFQQTNAVSQESDYILYVGNIKPHKNIETAIKAFNELNYNNYRFVITGSYEELNTRDRTVKHIAEESENIEFTGYVSEQKLLKLYREASLFVFPSTYEGFGFPPLEAMASRTPTLVAETASLPEICGDGVLYFDPYDESELAEKIARVLNDQNLQNKLTERGYKRAQKYSWDSSATNHVNIIEEILFTE
jgi:glycosyltransferase involved in cell wall biosynthesis